MFYEVLIDRENTAVYFKTRAEADYYIISKYIKWNGSITEDEFEYFLDNSEIEDFGAVFTNEFQKFEE